MVEEDSHSPHEFTHEFTHETPLESILACFRPQTLMVVGDLMLDQYTYGVIDRISPEAPVSVVHVQKQESRPGGAGNTARNLISLGQKVSLVSRIGDDPTGATLKKALQQEGIQTEGLYVDSPPTILKNRIIAAKQQIMRVDHEVVAPLSPNVEKEMIDTLPTLLNGVSAVAISDYGKGMVTPSLLQTLIPTAREKGIPVIVDPKGNDFARYRGASLIKPNLKEAFLASGLCPDSPLEEVAQVLFEQTMMETLMITRGDQGVTLFWPSGERLDLTTQSVEVRDVTGAGDTVLAATTVALANGLSLAHSASLANELAGLAVQRFGCAPISLGDLVGHLIRQNHSSKIFSKKHLFAFEYAMEDHPYALLKIDGGAITSELYRAILRLKENHKLVVQVEEKEEEMISFLSSLREVDFILLETDALEEAFPQVFSKTQPKKIHCFNACPSC